MKHKSKMNTWGSVMTPKRAKAMPDVVRKIERASRNPVNRQMGNIIGDLRNLHEFDLIEELKREVEAYNEEAERFNKRLDDIRSIRYELKKFRRGKRFWRAYESAFPYGIGAALDDAAGDSYLALSRFRYEYSQYRG